MKNSTRAIKGGKQRFVKAVLIVAKGAACGLAAIMLLLLIYLLAVPVVLSGISAFRPRRLNLDEAKSYYALIAAGVASVVGAAGVFLGAFYYFNRLAWETQRAKRDRGRARLDELYRRIEEIDQLVFEVVLKPDEDEFVRRQAYKVLRALSSFQQLLDAAADLAGMSDEQLAAVVRFYSYVERRCQSLLEVKVDSAAVKSGAIDGEEYGDRLYDARDALHACGSALA